MGFLAGITGGIEKAMLWINQPEGTLFSEMGNVMEVQFNPKSLRFSTRAGTYQQNAGAGDLGVNQLTQMTLEPTTSLGVELVFDDVNNSDAFAWGSLSPSIGGAVQMASAFLQEHSVRKPVEALIGLTTESTTRNVTFGWGTMKFTGELESVNAAYTMFNPSGNPIRAIVSLSIRDTKHDTVKGKKGVSQEKGVSDYWDQAFARIFGSVNTPTGTLVIAKSRSSLASNFLNLNF